MAKISDTKIPITNFLEAYKRQPCLYNTALDSYKNRSSREEALEAIIRELKIPHLTALDVKLKIKSIRTVYTKELRILMRENELGKKYEPKLFWFKTADSFLRSVSLSSSKGLKRRISPVNLETTRNDSNMSVAHLMEDGMDESGYDDYDTDHHELRVRPNSLPVPVTLTASDRANTRNNELHQSNVTLGNGEINFMSPPRGSPHISNKGELITNDCVLESLRKNAPVQNQQYPYYQQSSRQPIPQFLPPLRQQQHDNSNPIYFGPSNGFSTNTEDELLSFGNSIACQIRALPDPYIRSYVKMRIQQLLFEAETDEFTRPARAASTRPTNLI